MPAADSLTTAPDREELSARYSGLLDVLRGAAASADTAGELPEEVFAALRASGVLGAAVAEEYGGLGGDAVLTNRLIELVAAADPSMAIILFQHYAVSARIGEWGTDAQRARYLPLLAGGEWIAASAWSESGAGADKRNLATKATRVEGGWRLDGAKTFTTGAASRRSTSCSPSPPSRAGSRAPTAATGRRSSWSRPPTPGWSRTPAWTWWACVPPRPASSSCTPARSRTARCSARWARRPRSSPGCGNRARRWARCRRASPNPPTGWPSPTPNAGAW
ncbi:acyl-CoA dehydrogenase family protein [Streptomyces stramineus]